MLQRLFAVTLNTCFSCCIFPMCNGKYDPPKWHYFSACKYALEHETDLINV